MPHSCPTQDPNCLADQLYGLVSTGASWVTADEPLGNRRERPFLTPPRSVNGGRPVVEWATTCPALSAGAWGSSRWTDPDHEYMIVFRQKLILA